jgi:hypothetical protein
MRKPSITSPQVIGSPSASSRSVKAIKCKREWDWKIKSSLTADGGGEEKSEVLVRNLQRAPRDRHGVIGGFCVYY